MRPSLSLRSKSIINYRNWAKSRSLTSDKRIHWPHSGEGFILANLRVIFIYRLIITYIIW